MRSRVIFIVCAVFASMLGVSAMASGPRTEQRGYLNGPLASCSVSIACFPLDGTDASVDLVVSDEIRDHVGAKYYFLNAQSGPGDNLGMGSFCDSVDDIPVPREATQLKVSIGDVTLYPPLNWCTPLFPGDGLSDDGTVGTITATFR